MPEQTFELNDETVTVDVDDDARMLEVIREMLGVTGPGAGPGRESGPGAGSGGMCGGVCSACPRFDGGTA